MRTYGQLYKVALKHLCYGGICGAISTAYAREGLTIKENIDLYFHFNITRPKKYSLWWWFTSYRVDYMYWWPYGHMRVRRIYLKWMAWKYRHTYPKV